MTVRAEFNTCKRSQWSRQVLHDRKKLTHLSERWKKALRQLGSLHPWKDHRTCAGVHFHTGEVLEDK